jgi:hypothetical protein
MKCHPKTFEKNKKTKAVPDTKNEVFWYILLDDLSGNSVKFFISKTRGKFFKKMSNKLLLELH